MAPLSYHSNPFELIRPGINGLKPNVLVYFLTLLSYIAVFFVVFAVAFVSASAVPALALVFVPLSLILFISYLILPFYRLTLASAKHQSMPLGEAFRPDVALSWKFFGTQILSALFIILGFIALIVPGVILVGRYALVPYIVLEEGTTGWAALQRSSELVRGHLVESWGTLGLSSATNIFALIPFVGPILTAVASLLLLPVIALRYLELVALKSNQAVDAVKPAVSGWNYVAIVVALVAGGASSYHSYTLNHAQNTTIQYNNNY